MSLVAKLFPQLADSSWRRLLMAFLAPMVLRFEEVEGVGVPLPLRRLLRSFRARLLIGGALTPRRPCSEVMILSNTDRQHKELEDNTNSLSRPHVLMIVSGKAIIEPTTWG